MQIQTFRVILQGDTKPLWGARETAVDLWNLNGGLSLLLQILTVFPDILIWYKTDVYRQTTHTHMHKFAYSKLGEKVYELFEIYFE